MTVVHLIPADALLEVESEERGNSPWKGVAMHACMHRGGELRMDTVSGDYCVIARHTTFGAAVNRRRPLLIIHNGQKPYVTEVANACAAEMGVPKTDDDIITHMIT